MSGHPLPVLAGRVGRRIDAGSGQSTSDPDGQGGEPAGAGTATPNDDYLPRTYNLVIPAGQTSYKVSLPIVGDTVHESSPETVNVILSNVVGATVAQGTATCSIVDND